MSLSSNSVIHFTKNITNLKAIISNNFRVHYCRETIYSKSKKMDLLIPMVSFCDIPFSQIMKHIDSYGNYGIGLKKCWAERKGLNPVFYIEKNSALSDNIIHNLYNKIKEGKLTIGDLDLQDKYNLDFLRYLKNYQGDLCRKGKTKISEYRFSDEREWRYVISPDSKYFAFLKLSEEHQEKIPSLKRVFNKLVVNESLKFEPEDISYIIIKNEKERDTIIKELEEANNRFPFEQVKRLTSRIITVEQIKTDF